jgi:hypothetical protein
MYRALYKEKLATYENSFFLFVLFFKSSVIGSKLTTHSLGDFHTSELAPHTVYWVKKSIYEFLQKEEKEVAAE